MTWSIYNNLDINKIKINEKSCRNNFIHYIRHVTVKYLSYAKINNVNPLYLIINKINWNIDKNNGNKYLTILPTDESKDTLKKYEELLNKITLKI